MRPIIATIKMGSLLLAEGTPLPDSVLLESTPYVPDWRLLKNVNSKGLTELLRRVGWNFFCLATELETTVYGWNRETTLRKAIQRITAQSKAAQYNCVEIKQVEERRFLGFPFLRITAHSRQIQHQGSLAGGRARLSYASG